MKKQKRWLRWLKWFSLLSSLFPLFIPVLLLMLLNTNNYQQSSSGGDYTDSWSTGDPYTHNLFIKRYGITAEQLDGYLTSTGISYDSERINGKRLLEWERISGVDVRAIVAMAQMESSFGTAGVARNKGANMFGYGAFDSNPDNANNFSDRVAVVQLAEVTLKGNKNETFKIQDDKARKYANGTLNVAVDGGVYFTDITGSGRRRADVMKRVDDWVNSHGGTSKLPATVQVTGGGTIASSWEFPVEYTGKLKYGQPSSASLTTQAGSGYPAGQCTWYVYNRLMEIGIINAGDGYGYLGNGQDWVGSLTARGWKQLDRPVAGAIVSMAYGQYGHVAFIEHVNDDGSFLLSECNYAGNQSQVHFQVTTHQANFTYAVRN